MKRKSPGVFLGGIWWIPPVFCAVCPLLLRNIPAGILTAFAVNSLLTFLVYAADKRAAKSGGERVPEFALHCWELCCGWPGALLAQHLLRHKNRKLPYQIVFYLVVIINAAILFLSILYMERKIS